MHMNLICAEVIYLYDFVYYFSSAWYYKNKNIILHFDLFRLLVLLIRFIKVNISICFQFSCNINAWSSKIYQNVDSKFMHFHKDRIQCKKKNEKKKIWARDYQKYFG